ncbi:ferritin-like domain-containing protein [Streptacidiphilus sp. N1-12]|uniref:Ferritin-like domain-containing protein n=2 Tax=Streptacidiphilus alkalitolerans TaxID=3342712 RepID=A0ABV6VN02_9ACTN
MTTSAPGIGRRSLLSAGLLGLLTACGSSAGGSSDGLGARAVLGPDPDLPVRARALAATRTLAAGYDAALAAFPELGARLTPLRTQLDRQLTVFGATRPGATATATGTPAASGAPAPAPASAGAAVLTLDAAERGTAAARNADLAHASPALARQLASAAACAAQHSMLLRGTVPDGPADAAPATTPLPPAALAALQAALAAEDAAVYAYGVIGARLSGPRRTRATASYQAHRARRGELQQRIAASGAVPEAAAPAYQLPAAVTGTASAVRLAGLVEDRICAVYANAVQATAGPLRAAMAAALRRSALDTLAWRGSGTAFPGLPDD